MTYSVDLVCVHSQPKMRQSPAWFHIRIRFKSEIEPIPVKHHEGERNPCIFRVIPGGTFWE